MKIASGICADAVGNSNPGIDSAAFKIDLTAPTVSVGGVTLNAIYDRGAVPVATCDTQDALSGVKVAATVSVSGGTSNGVGTYTAKCSGGKDEADNVRADVSLTYKVQYPVAGISGILQPINSTTRASSIAARPFRSSSSSVATSPPASATAAGHFSGKSRLHATSTPKTRFRRQSSRTRRTASATTRRPISTSTTRTSATSRLERAGRSWSRSIADRR